MRKNVFVVIMIASLVMATGLLAQGQDRPFQPKPPRMAALDLTDEQMAKIQDMELNLEKENALIVSMKRELTYSFLTLSLRYMNKFSIVW